MVLKRKCPRCPAWHELPQVMCRECNARAVQRYRAGDKHARTTHYHKKRATLEEPLCSVPPPPPPGFRDSDLTTGRPLC